MNALSNMSPQKFELFSRGLLKQMGVDIDDEIGIQYVADGGLDGFGYITSDDFRTTRVALQSKRWENKVSTPEIDKFSGAMDKYNAEFGIFITTSDFTREAIKVARQGTRVITLINGDKICDLVAKYQYYVQPVTTYKLGSFYTDKD
ncbi:Mrr restriction system protein [Apilactobacillus kunkeei]|nr:Mrr restriction system protein [Apilactobacillus kunkeei]CAI2622518.1 Mrr restriction system protein [Apilactobacillus kunkeei]CAI2802675.1 Mrr restriction system protein [Apilactobacillus kunkeei]